MVWRTAACLALATLAASGCGDASPTGPAPAIALTLPATVEGRIVTCEACQDPPFITVVAVFPVAIQNAGGPAGTLDTVETSIVNRTRFTTLVRNVRPNPDFTYADRELPAGGSLVVEAGAGAPLPPPRDEVIVTVTVRMTDGRVASAVAPLAVIG